MSTIQSKVNLNVARDYEAVNTKLDVITSSLDNIQKLCSLTPQESENTLKEAQALRSRVQPLSHYLSKLKACNQKIINTDESIKNFNQKLELYNRTKAKGPCCAIALTA